MPETYEQSSPAAQDLYKKISAICIGYDIDDVADALANAIATALTQALPSLDQCDATLNALMLDIRDAVHANWDRVRKVTIHSDHKPGNA